MEPQQRWPRPNLGYSDIGWMKMVPVVSTLVSLQLVVLHVMLTESSRELRKETGKIKSWVRLFKR
jgi:hypothetical protein